MKSLETYCKEEKLEYLLEEWDSEKNRFLTPKQASKTSRSVVWWKCKECGFEWQTQIASRAIGKTRCPECYRKWLESKRKKD